MLLVQHKAYLLADEVCYSDWPHENTCARCFFSFATLRKVRVSSCIYSDIGRIVEDKQERITKSYSFDVRLQQMRELTSDKRAAESSEERKGKWHSLIAGW